MMKIFKLKKETIFCAEYEDLTENNEIEFSNNKIAVIYGPNGTGKTSLSSILEKTENSEFDIEFNNIRYTNNGEPFAHIIHDQNGRNIIQGSTEDFILGDNIKKEYQLKEHLDTGFRNLYDTLIAVLKDRFGITTKNSVFLSLVEDNKLKGYISDLANNKQKGNNIDKKEFLDYFTEKNILDISSYDDEKFCFFVNDKKNKTSCLNALLQLQKNEFCKEDQYIKIEQTNDAISILKKYQEIHNCIICDNDIDQQALLIKKSDENKNAYNNLSDKSKKIIDGIIMKIPVNDKFDIKKSLEEVFVTGNLDGLDNLLAEIEKYEVLYKNLLTNEFINIVKDANLLNIYNEYMQILSEKPEFEDEDVIFIENFLNSCLEKKITLSRDKNKNIRLLLDNKEFLNQERTSLKLSNGEQNFLSLSFELLKAKKIEKQLVVLDDPISSFDSIYKNKIAYAIIKFLSSKYSLILTHNTDLIKLLEHQLNNSFTLYYMNNTEGETNGFLKINDNEKQILLYIPSLIKLFCSEIAPEILDEMAFLISITPFLRGYCYLIQNNEKKDALTKIMHGYETANINLSSLYNELFQTNIIKKEHIISASDILAYDIDNLNIIKKDKFPLLAKTLIHSFTYLYLRMTVEKKLVDKYGIDTTNNYMLNQIINRAFPTNNEDLENTKNRIFFLSKKTLLNEFNHFEMDMNIFQPAIDITNKALENEKEEILKKLDSL
ncbi:AAA family ATPase [Treponema denticola]|uniref:AAA family ATPase n=1 Tax=Treponema denticola TaxID=158 RepID=UPI0011C85B7F|nr:AAA family ATPase [Treponema denticola]